MCEAHLVGKCEEGCPEFDSLLDKGISKGKWLIITR